jgi:hypothetical protein
LSLNIEKQEMRNYLLGSLETDRRAAIEESILCDSGVYEELLIVEEELIDGYLTNNLSPSERQQFETHFLITAERQKKLRFGRLLRRYLSSHPVIVPPEDIPVAVRQDEIPAPAHKFFPFATGASARGAALAVSAMVVVSLLVLVVLCWRTTRKPGQHTAQQNSPIIDIPLMPGSLRSEGAVTPRVNVPAKGINVRLKMPVTNIRFRNYKSELFRENESLQSANELKAEPDGGQHIVPWTITGDVLSPGDYQVKLKGVVNSGEDQFIDNYSFRVVKK